MAKSVNTASHAQPGHFHCVNGPREIAVGYRSGRGPTWGVSGPSAGVRGQGGLTWGISGPSAGVRGQGEA